MDATQMTRRGQCFHRWMRLVRAGDFGRVYKQGSRARGDHVTIAAVANGTAGTLAVTRLGLSIGKRVWKGAVRRNRLRRLFREAFRLEYDGLPRGFDLVVIGSTPKLVIGLADARRELRKLSHKAARRAVESMAITNAGRPEEPH